METARGSAPPPPARIAVVDDDRVTREYVAGLLRGHGYRVIAVDGAQKLLDLHRQGQVDLVLLDVMMEGLSGVDCCRILKSTTPPEIFVPVILVTGRTDPESRIEGLRIGADDYVTKPFDERELLARVEAMLRIKRSHDDLGAARERLQRLAVQDELTGLYNVRYLNSRLTEEYKRAERHRDPLALAMIDVDHFKQVNDRFGHEAGDAVLREVGVRLKKSVREIDVVTRYGGEEFVVLLPSTHLAGALVVADRVARTLREEPFDVAGTKMPVTASIGLALFPSRGVHSKEELLRSADRALYRAKDEGRDRICVFQEQGYLFAPGKTG
ncbi:diguanylate cyclase [Sandaracinus amylolyticus]|uniref:diguanylate cyclase n=1 Tax=Sandaracinus amylolyticus TaxID=927083 RepID=A0A0F6W557_9BACT|nr:diguanylate cyclase [Sandaracinus amylolyticus]AKF07546.1 diguanylate cyclase/phosphodiesterase (GGDEF & EAL domains) with PAS/PAC sensor(s) [Sandaracinus amylolyticus]